LVYHLIIKKIIIRKRNYNSIKNENHTNYVSYQRIATLNKTP